MYKYQVLQTMDAKPMLYNNIVVLIYMIEFVSLYLKNKISDT